MNFDDAIKSHANWKMVLTSYVRTPDRSIKADVVGDQHKCDLGHWLLGDGSHYSNRQEFRDLKEAHECFHKSAADVIRRADAGENVNSEVALGGTSQYAQCSAKVISLLMAMKREKL